MANEADKDYGGHEMGVDDLGLCGTVVDGRYRIDEVVGEGGFGIVYRGYHLRFEHAIAIKVLKLPDHFIPEARTRFLSKFWEEGKVLSRLASTHLSIVRVFDSGAIDCHGEPIPYLVLEWLEGRDLGAIIRERSSAGQTFGETEALIVLRPAVEAIAAAHALGIAHRDIKPENLFVVGEPGGSIKVLDFGIAKAMAEGESATQRATQTSSGFRAFTPRYGSPEQFVSSKFGPSGPWSDVHALGLVLTEMVCGRAAYGQGAAAELYQAATLDPRPTPRTLGAAVSTGFEALCRRALALRPTDRLADAGALLAAMDALPSATVLQSPATTPTSADSLPFVATELPAVPSTIAAGPATPQGALQPPTVAQSPAVPATIAAAPAKPQGAPQPPTVVQAPALTAWAEPAWRAAPQESPTTGGRPVQRRFGGATLPFVLGAVVLGAAALYFGIGHQDTESEPEVNRFTQGEPEASKVGAGAGSATRHSFCHPCKGRGSNALTSSVEWRATQVGKRCWKPAMGNVKLRVRLRVGSDGGVCGLDFPDSSAAPEVLQNCIAEELGREQFFAPPDGCVAFVIPLRFKVQ